MSGSGDDEEWELEKILDKRTLRKKTEYLVQFKRRQQNETQNAQNASNRNWMRTMLHLGNWNLFQSLICMVQAIAVLDYHHPVDSVAVRNARLARFLTARGLS